MPKYLTRIEFESMKVLRNRKCTIKQISEKMHMSAPAVSRNLEYHSYEDYCLSMHNRNSRGGREIEAKSGPVKIIKSAGSKKCNNCGKEKPLEDFVKDKKCKGGRSGQCKKCRQEYIAKWKAKKDATVETVQAGKTYRKCGKAKPITELQSAEEPKEEEKKPKFVVDQYVLVEHKGKVKGAHLVAKCSDEYSAKWVVELCNWRRAKLIVSEDDMYTEDAC